MNARRFTIVSLVLLLLLLSITTVMAAHGVSGTSNDLVGPPAPNCPDGAFLWEQEIDIENLVDGRFPTAEKIDFYPATLYTIPPETYPQELAGPVTVTISEAVAWDGYSDREKTGDQPNERFKVVFLQGGSIVWESNWSGEELGGFDGLATGYRTAWWLGPLGGPQLLPNGTDEILLVHWRNAEYGEGDLSSPNSVAPTSVCIEYEPFEEEEVGTGTPGYWAASPVSWPWPVSEITIGGVTYSAADARSLMLQGGPDMTYRMFDALVAAKLNVASGADASCINDTITAADEWMAAYGPVGSGVTAGGPDSPWREGEPLYETLDAYNNGELCAPSRDSLE